MSPTKAERLRSRMPAVDPDALAPALAQPVAPTAVEQAAATDATAPAQSQVTAESPQAEAASEPQPTERAARRAVPPARTDSRAGWKTALDDPTAVEGKMEYVSYYLPRNLKLRFSAAMHWTARDRRIERELPESMSKAVAEFIEGFVTELERDYNDGEVFPPTPDQLKGPRRRKS